MDRRAVIAGSGSGWSPQSATPIAWFYAATPYVTLNGASVSGWLDRSGNGNNLDQSSAPSQPTWESSGGWSSSKSSIKFLAQSLNSVSGPLLTVFSGNSKPFTVLATVQVLAFADPATVVSWDDTLITARQNCTVTASQFISAKREDDIGSSHTVTASILPVGTGHVRLAYVFSPSQFDLYVNGAVAISDGGFIVNTCTFTRFRLGDGPEVGPDSINGRIAEVVIYPRALAASEVAAYYSYSLNEWG